MKKLLLVDSESDFKRLNEFCKNNKVAVFELPDIDDIDINSIRVVFEKFCRKEEILERLDNSIDSIAR